MFHMLFFIIKVLHLATYNNNTELVKLFLEHTINHPSSKVWINIVNEEGFTALHMASYRGNLVSDTSLPPFSSAISRDPTSSRCQLSNPKLLGAPSHSCSRSRQLASHDRRSTPFITSKGYWMEKGLDINIKDDRGSTPLHWAVYQGSEQSVNFLIAWGA